MAMDIRNQVEYIAFRGLLGSLRLLGYPLAKRTLEGAGRFTESILGIRRQVVRQQLAAIYPEESSRALDSLTHLVYNHLALTVAEVFCADSDRLLAQVRVEPGWQGVDEALALGRGAIVAAGHIGNFELGGAVLARRFRLLDVVKQQRNIPFDRYLENKRHSRGIETVPMQRCGRRVLQHLRSGGLVSLLLDQDAGNQGLTTSFLGRPASTWPGVARFAMHTGCPVIPMALIRDADGGHVLRIRPTLMPPAKAAGPQGVQDFLQEVSTSVEVFIWENPEQWFWVHRRWKSRKGG